MRRVAPVALGVLVASLFACKTHAATAIVLSLRSELRLPAELDTLEVEATRGGATRFSQSYELDGRVVPGTLTFTTDDDEASPLSLTVRGKQGGAQRLVRTARLGFVDQKSKLLRITLEYACLDVVCGDASTTCVSGACVSVDVDPAALPDFDGVSAELPPPGTAACFDESRCLAGATAAVLDEGCSFAAPSSGFNVALVWSASPAHPVTVVPGPAGYTVTGDRVALSPALCGATKSGKVSAVLVSTACPAVGAKQVFCVPPTGQGGAAGAAGAGGAGSGGAGSGGAGSGGAGAGGAGSGGAGSGGGGAGGAGSGGAGSGGAGAGGAGFGGAGAGGAGFGGAGAGGAGLGGAGFGGAGAGSGGAGAGGAGSGGAGAGGAGAGGAGAGGAGAGGAGAGGAGSGGAGSGGAGGGAVVALVPVADSDTSFCLDGSVPEPCETAAPVQDGQDTQNRAVFDVVTATTAHDLVTDHTWHLTSTSKGPLATARAECAARGGGARLASWQELLGILDYGSPTTLLWSPIGTASATVWTDTVDPTDPSKGLAWNLTTGAPFADLATIGSWSGICVSGPTVGAAGFGALDADLSLDVRRGLVWQTQPAPGTSDWLSALGTCGDLDVGGYADWRLPSVKELLSLSDEASVASHLSPALVAGSGSTYWSSTPVASTLASAWAVDFAAGPTALPVVGVTTTPFDVRCVRGGGSYGGLADSINSHCTDGAATGLCDGTGIGTYPKHQDGMLSLNAPTYRSSPPLIEDLTTGLVWEHALDPTPRTHAVAVSRCQSLSTGGKTDWRLPSRIELSSIVDYGRVQQAVHPTFGIPTTFDAHWTSDADANNVANAWDVNFFAGFSLQRPVTDAVFVRCVRGPTRSAPSFSSNGSVARDASTLLDWQAGLAVEDVTWDVALSTCASLVLDGKSDWRLPTAKELLTFVDLTQNPVVPLATFPTSVASRATWSSTPFKNGVGVWVMFVDSGELQSTGVGATDLAHARCVRGPY